MIKKVLIANRGEIAVRIIRTCREMGIKSVAVFSEADRITPHVLLADEAYNIGPAPSSASYLKIESILKAIKISGADAVHPGYGFLSENADFSEQIKSYGIKWIGPPENSIKIMGDKVMARKMAEKLDIPLIPGTVDPVSDSEKALKIAEEIGYPILVKAVGGGGGKGMRIVNQKGELINAIDRAMSEAENAFSDPRIYLEKYLEDPHHIEIQILSDTHGNHISLGERECSIQRRYQKIIEETPSPFIDADLRKELSQAAVKIANSCAYEGAGTVEFLVDNNKKFYFLEMNTRLQVEHPVTEMVTGIDLVREQINIANGEKLSVSPDIKSKGHAIECRIYAEDGLNNFQPSIGKIIDYFPPSGPGVRMDEGFIKGQEISPYYDPMLGKLIVWAGSRAEACSRMSRALSEMKITGVKTTTQVCKSIVDHASFKEGDYCTHTLEQILPEILQGDSEISTDLMESAAAVIGAKIIKQPIQMKSENEHTLWSDKGRIEEME